MVARTSLGPISSSAGRTHFAGTKICCRVYGTSLPVDWQAKYSAVQTFDCSTGHHSFCFLYSRHNLIFYKHSQLNFRLGSSNFIFYISLTFPNKFWPAHLVNKEYKDCMFACLHCYCLHNKRPYDTIGRGKQVTSNTFNPIPLWTMNQLNVWLLSITSTKCTASVSICQISILQFIDISGRNKLKG